MTRRIFVIDDDPNVRTAVRAVLRGAGYEVVEAAFGAGALAQARAFRPDLVLVDLVLPDMSGADLLDGLRAMDPALRPVVVAFSGYYGTEDEARDANPGFDAYLTKPMRGARLLQEVEELLRSTNSPPPPA